MTWIIAFILLVIFEVVTQMMWSLCLAIGCLVAMVLYFCGVDLAWQLAAMCVASLIAYVLLMPIFNRWHRKHADRKADRTGMDALLGRRAVVTETILPLKPGRVRIDGDNWQATAPGCPFAINPGEEVTVTAYDSIILSVTMDRN